jgi:hypothetical protein
LQPYRFTGFDSHHGYHSVVRGRAECGKVFEKRDKLGNVSALRYFCKQRWIVGDPWPAENRVKIKSVVSISMIEPHIEL